MATAGCIFNQKKPTPEMNALLRQSGSNDETIARAAMRELAVALTLPLKQGVLKGDILEGIFQRIVFEPGQAVEFPLDFLAPGTEGSHIAFTVPTIGRIPERAVEGDYVMVPTYRLGNTIDWNLRYAIDARWDVVARAMQVLEAGHTRKKNNDGWHVILAAGKARNISVYDDAATSGLFTKRLIALMKTVMRRNAGGNSTSINKGKLTDVYMSPEGLEDVRSWDLTQVDDFTRRDIFLSGGDEAALTRVFGVTLHDIDEFGVGQEYQLYYTNTLGGTMPSDKSEVVIGLDLLNSDSFVQPVRQEFEAFEDLSFHRQGRASLYSAELLGFGSLDGRRVVIGAI